LESIRTQARNDWASFSTLAVGQYCMAEGVSEVSGGPVTSCNKNINNLFVRSVDISTLNCGTGARKATVTVAWSDSKCANDTDYCHNALLETCLNNINSVPTP